MSVAEVLEEEAKMPKLRLLQGGKGPPSDDNPPKDWMSQLPVGAVFSCRKKGQTENYALMMLQICYKHDKTIIISDALNNNPYAAVDPVEFSKRHDFHELLEGEPNNGHNLRTIQPAGMAHNVDAEAGQPGDDPVGPE